MKKEIEQQLLENIIPFWQSLRDNEHGGYTGLVDYNLRVDKRAVKGCILNNRITWFFSKAYMMYRTPKLLSEATHAYEFLRDYCIDEEYGGVYWSVEYDGTPSDTTKHTYNQAFAIYALSAYYEATQDEEALDLAFELYDVIENRCTDDIGYLESFKRDFSYDANNEKLSENGVIAAKTMNTLLHVIEAYTQLYRVSGDDFVKESLTWALEILADKVYNYELKRQEVFFDEEYNSIIDLYSYGHDIEASWLIDLALDVLKEDELTAKLAPITDEMCQQVFEKGFDGHSLPYECEKGVDNEHRAWWVQAENIVGLVNGYNKHPQRTDYLSAAESQWQFIKDYMIDKRPHSEWLNEVMKDGSVVEGMEIAGEWKCPYHNGRMCMEVIRRL